MQELTFEQVESVSGGFQGLNGGPEELLKLLADLANFTADASTDVLPEQMSSRIELFLGAFAAWDIAGLVVDGLNSLREILNSGNITYPLPIPTPPENYEGGPHQNDPLL